MMARRTLNQYSALALSIVLVAPACAERPSDSTELVLTNARVYTLDEARPWADAVAIRGDRIVAVGTAAEAKAAVSGGARELDLGGAFALPGFNDAHVHIDSTGALLLGVNLLDVHESSRFTERIREAAQRMPKGSWITRGEWGAYEQWEAGSAGGVGGAADAGGGSRRTAS